MNNRVIKFRAYCISNKKMYPVAVIEFTDLLEGRAGINVYIENLKTQMWIDKNDFELMAFTGLLDKNGKEIFEGDILKLDDVIGEVTYSDGSFQMILDSSAGRSPILQERTKYFIVIGNIFETPSLLNP